MGGREPDISGLAKKLTKKKLDCTVEIRDMMDCMMKFSLSDADGLCMKQRAALALCARQAANKPGARSELAYHLRRLTTLWKKFGY